MRPSQQVIVSRSQPKFKWCDQRNTNNHRNLFANFPSTRFRKSAANGHTSTVNYDRSAHTAEYHNGIAPRRSIRCGLQSDDIGHGRHQAFRLGGVTSGALPEGLDLNASNGNIFGAPTSTGSFKFRLRVTDQTSQSDEQNFTIVINSPAPPSITSPSSLQEGIVNQPYPNTQLTATGGATTL